MQKILAGCAGLFLLLNEQVHAGEVICPAVTDIQRNIETADDIYSVNLRDDREWASQSLVDKVDPVLSRFNGAEYALHESTEDELAPTRTNITCKYGQINLTLEYLQVRKPYFSRWTDDHCESLQLRDCKLIDADHANVTF